VRGKRYTRRKKKKEKRRLPFFNPKKQNKMSERYMQRNDVVLYPDGKTETKLTKEKQKKKKYVFILFFIPL
jgi:hypothetical protein